MPNTSWEPPAPSRLLAWIAFAFIGIGLAIDVWGWQHGERFHFRSLAYSLLALSQIGVGMFGWLRRYPRARPAYAYGSLALAIGLVVWTVASRWG